MHEEKKRFEEYMQYVLGKPDRSPILTEEDLRIAAENPFGHGYRRGFADGAASVGKRETSEQA
jgi:hypothetical protein